MMRSEAFNWSVAIVLSLLVHSMMFIGRGAQMGAENAIALPVPLITRLSFNKPIGNVAPDEPRPVEKQRPKPVKKVGPRLVVEKPIKDNQVTERTAPVEKIEPVRQITSPAQAQGQQVSHSSDGLLQRKRQQYLHELLSHIESFKFYPRAARRRSLEGNVKISFMLRDDGYCEQPTFDGRHSALAKAARQALESAMPLPVPPEDIEVPRKIEFAMVYSLAH